MKKTKVFISLLFLISLAFSIVMGFMSFISMLQNVSSGTPFEWVYLIAFGFFLSIFGLCGIVHGWVRKKEEKRKAEVMLFSELNKAIRESTERMKNIGLMPTQFKVGGITSNEANKTVGAEKVYEALKELDKSILEHLERKKKRSHHSRKNSFDVQKAVERGMAMYVDGKRHVYVGLKPSPAGTATEVRGISNGVFYGYLDHIGKGIHNANGKIKGYLINI